MKASDFFNRGDDDGDDESKLGPDDIPLDDLMDPIGFTYRELYALGIALTTFGDLMASPMNKHGHDALSDEIGDIDQKLCICGILKDANEKLSLAHDMAVKRNENGGNLLPKNLTADDFKK